MIQQRARRTPAQRIIKHRLTLAVLLTCAAAIAMVQPTTAAPGNASGTAHASIAADTGTANAIQPGGTLTRITDNRNSFALPAPTLDPKQLRDFNFGNRLFNTNWTVAPSSANGFDGLGPTFNRVSCSACHLRDGRGRPPQHDEKELLSMLVRISLPGTNRGDDAEIQGDDAHGGPRPHPDYGDQLNDRAIPGVPAEGRVEITYDEIAGAFADGTPYSLRKPRVTLHDPAFGPFDDLLLSARVAQHMPGVGLLEAVPEADIVARADPDDRDGDGISGRANRVWNPIMQRTELGRFGWKANVATLQQQTAAAAHGDIGLTSSAFPTENCPPAQTACAAAPTGGAPELSDRFLDRIVFYLQTLAVPARRGAERDEVRRGENVFKEMNCGSCHAPILRTAPDTMPVVLADQTLAPYTDLLLHDMGEGLADGRPDFLADGREWRTPPLWSIGLFKAVNDHTNYLHDGRARNLEEAILWHGGEASAAQKAFIDADATTRRALIAFLESL
nr:di-heme oxidoredictase family protein [Chiayiivirga flava]